MPRHALCLALLLALAPGFASAAGFTYRGQLVEEGRPAEGLYDLQITLHADATGRRPLANPIELIDVAVRQGRFAAALDLPETGASIAWLEVSVRPVGEIAWWPLGGREAVSLKAAACPAAWELTGNAGTFPNMHFLGTTDNQPLQLGANNSVAAVFRMDTTDPQNNKAMVQLGAPTNIIASQAFNTSIGGGGFNTVHDQGGTVGGGENNIAGSDDGDGFAGGWATVGGGSLNRATGSASTVAGGSGNRALGVQAAVGGGGLNQADGLHATIAGGGGNLVTAQDATVGGGGNNFALRIGATVPGGTSNSANGSHSFAGGNASCAGGDRSWAIGTRAQVRTGTSTAGGPICAGSTGTSAGDTGTFVWADSQDLNFLSSGMDQFLIRARGGVGINAPPITDAVELTVVADSDGSDVANLFFRQRTNNAGILISASGAASTGANDASFFLDHFNGAGGQARRLELRGDGLTIIRSNATGSSSGVSMAAGAGAWSSLSDRSVKTAVAAIDPLAVLDRLIALPISEWSYIAQGEGIRHLGPMAQDFAAAFRLGENDTTISSIDADGVALAAIQGLNTKLERENAALRERMTTLDADLAALRQQLAALLSTQEN